MRSLDRAYAAVLDNAVIMQILPADGWYAVMQADDPPYYRLSRLIAWALVKNVDMYGEYQTIEGVDTSEYGATTDVDQLIEYIHESAITPECHEAWARVGHAS